MYVLRANEAIRRGIITGQLENEGKADQKTKMMLWERTIDITWPFCWVRAIVVLIGI